MEDEAGRPRTTKQYLFVHKPDEAGRPRNGGRGREAEDDQTVSTQILYLLLQYFDPPQTEPRALAAATTLQ